MKKLFIMIVIFIGCEGSSHKTPKIINSWDNTRFELRIDIVYDKETKLYWQSTPTTQTFNFSEAKKYCKNLSYGGYSDWELPSIYLLDNLTNDQNYKPAIATNLISIKNSKYWSSTSNLNGDDTSRALFLNFKGGGTGWYLKSNNFNVLCVRRQ